VSTTRTLPFCSLAMPSSSQGSRLPEPVAVHVKVLGLSSAETPEGLMRRQCKQQALCIKVPLSRTMPAASPMPGLENIELVQKDGGFTFDQAFVTGSYMAPRLVHRFVAATSGLGRTVVFAAFEDHAAMLATRRTR